MIKITLEADGDVDGESDKYLSFQKHEFHGEVLHWLLRNIIVACEPPRIELVLAHIVHDCEFDIHHGQLFTEASEKLYLAAEELIELYRQLDDEKRTVVDDRKKVE